MISSMPVIDNAVPFRVILVTAGWGISCEIALRLTNWGWVTHICVSNLTIISSDNSLSPGSRQAIIWTNAEILFILPIGTNFIEILIEIHTYSFKEIHVKILSAKWRPFCLSLNVLMSLYLTDDKSILHDSGHQQSHYLCWCWPRSMWPYGVTRLQWVKWIQQ